MVVRAGGAGSSLAVTAPVPARMAQAYSRTGPAWERGPSRIYDRLARTLVDASPVPLRGRIVLDVGAGTGAASRAAASAGATVVAADFAPGMLAVDRHARPPATAADARSLPFRSATFGAVVAAFCYNHLPDPAAALREAARVTEPGGAVIASAYADDDDHPVKAAVETALTRAGWTRPTWGEEMSRNLAPRLATVERARAAAAEAGLDATVGKTRAEFPELAPGDLVAWRLGMAAYAEFLATLGEDEVREVRDTALAELGGAPPLVRSFIVIAARVAA